MMSKTVLSANNLSFSYNKLCVLEKMNIEFQSGKLYVIIGPNGCGKSTLIKNLYGFLKPQEGTITLNDKNLERFRHKERAQMISYVPQETQTNFDFSVFDMVAMGRSPYHTGIPAYNRNDIKIIYQAMKKTSVYDYRYKGINELSGGEKQSVMIARALAQDTPIILMDEPVSSLDINHQIDIMDTIKQLTHANKTVICVLHDLNLAAQYADTIALLHQGDVFAKGSAQEVLTEKNISQVYNVNVLVEYHKQLKRRLIIPISKHLP